MLSVSGVDRKVYPETLGRGGRVPAVPCPAEECGGELQEGHGFYQRYLDRVLFDVRRVICRACGVSNALLPEDVVAYRDATLTALEAATDAGPGPAAGAKAAGEKGTGAKRRVRRWGLKAGSRWVGLILALLPAGPQWWLDRVRAVVGAGQGALVRLRSWLWSKYRVYLGGPCGLYRLGRPGCRRRRRHPP
jgi:hypothetical protein